MSIKKERLRGTDKSFFRNVQAFRRTKINLSMTIIPYQQTKVN